MSNARLIAFAGISFCWGSFANHLSLTGLGLFNPVVLFSFAVLALVGLSLVPLAFFGRIGMALAAMIMVFLAADFHFHLVNSFIIAFLAIAISYWIAVPILRLVGVIFVVVFASAFLAEPSPSQLETDQPTEIRSKLPPVIHIILDEHGPETELPNSFFSIWSNAHSRHPRTMQSIPEMVGGFHQFLADEGYRLTIYRSAYFDICRPGQRCVEYNNRDLRPLAASAFGTMEIAKVVLEGWIRTSSNVMRMGDAIDPTIEATHVAPINTVRIFSDFAKRARSIGPGEAVIIHALLPHYPYALDQNCLLKPPRDWLGRYPPFPMGSRLRGYAEQRACSEKLVRSVMRDDAIIIVHGDHGRKFFDVAAGKDGRSLRAEKFRETYGTLFALHLPGQPGRHLDRPATISSLLEDLAASRLTEIPSGKDATVFTNDPEPKEKRMVY